MKRIFTLYLFILFCLILQAQEELYERVYVCLLYTSDAADE